MTSFRSLTFFLALLVTFTLQAEDIKTTTRILQFENEQVKVWKTIIMPDQPLKMHRHDCDRVVVGLDGGVLTKIESTGEQSDLIFETGVAYWLTQDPIDTLHADLNETGKPIVVMVIELKQNQPQS